MCSIDVLWCWVGAGHPSCSQLLAALARSPPRAQVALDMSAWMHHLQSVCSLV